MGSCISKSAVTPPAWRSTPSHALRSKRNAEAGQNAGHTCPPLCSPPCQTAANTTHSIKNISALESKDSIIINHYSAPVKLICDRSTANVYPDDDLLFRDSHQPDTPQTCLSGRYSSRSALTGPICLNSIIFTGSVSASANGSHTPALTTQGTWHAKLEPCVANTEDGEEEDGNPNGPISPLTFHELANMNGTERGAVTRLLALPSLSVGASHIIFEGGTPTCLSDNATNTGQAHAANTWKVVSPLPPGMMTEPSCTSPHSQCDAHEQARTMP